MKITFVKEKIYHFDKKDKKVLQNIISFALRNSRYMSKEQMKREGFTHGDAGCFYAILTRK